METTTAWQRAGAAAVHVYTASGAVLALLIVLAAIDGDVERALWLGLVALVVDGTDGMLARRMRVKERIPQFDGARLDDIVDYLTYAFAPVLLLWTGGYLPDNGGGLALAMLPLLASTYQFCRIDAKSDDHYFFFLGFPSYWNVVAFYVVVLDLPPAVVGAILLVCSALVFVPIGYVYPSRTVTLRPLTLALTAVWLVAYAVVLLQSPDPSPAWLAVSVAYLVYYVGLSLHLSLRRRSALRMAPPAQPASR
ncbi:CDP-alcohol phosphatidyltransferase family protein [Vallicoccus soli]|uniref:Phosphatidylcholine synthase n=1 Tax=Vallicoccus soli TaxID=2339232 RepID=A0A3A3Z1U1_9ACTN|nr:CDP-diacylglycerol O-phosphatidyltransferase [Vallicoccus soli]RJK95438.1 CDP-diacylglycerol O-phosphatidyltransferase [Vallicoccus soli]